MENNKIFGKLFLDLIMRMFYFEATKRDYKKPYFIFVYI